VSFRLHSVGYNLSDDLFVSSYFSTIIMGFAFQMQCNKTWTIYWI